MKQMLFIMVAVLATACASTSDVEQLQSQVTALEGKVAVVAADASSAKASAAEAAAKAGAAEASANRAAQYAQEVGVKLDRMFQKAQHK